MIRAYHRPENIERALQLISQTGVKVAVLTGQSLMDAGIDDTVDEVVDLQAVGLKEVSSAPPHLRIEAQVSLQTLVEHPEIDASIRDIIRREESYTMRNMRTISSVILGADSESQLLALLLVLDATVNIQNKAGSQQIPLAEFWQRRDTVMAGGLLTAVSLNTAGKIAAERVARTPADKAIVAAAARRTPDGTIRLAVAGIDTIPVLVDPQRLEAINPGGDFRGSSAYRKEMAIVLSRRVVAEVENLS